MKRSRSAKEVIAVTVVVNTLNRKDRLEQTLVALRQQTYGRFEVVVVNGPSTDGTEIMLERFTGRARLVNCAVANLGVSRNLGVQHAAGDVVAFIDDDAVPTAEWLARLVDPFANVSVGAVGGAVFDVPLDRIDWQICTCSRLGVPNTDSPPPIGRYLGIGVDPFAYLAGCNMSFSRRVLQRVGGFNSALSYAYDDAEVCCRINDAGYEIAYVKDALVYHHRAASAVRDEQQIIIDPLPLIRSRVIFAMQCENSPNSVDVILASANQLEREWIEYSTTQFASGHFSSDQHDAFVVRVRAAAIEGRRRGAIPREFVEIGPPPIDEFRQYR